MCCSRERHAEITRLLLVRVTQKGAKLADKHCQLNHTGRCGDMTVFINVIPEGSLLNVTVHVIGSDGTTLFLAAYSSRQLLPDSGITVQCHESSGQWEWQLEACNG